jgi:hypothetical protein
MSRLMILCGVMAFLGVTTFTLAAPDPAKVGEKSPEPAKTAAQARERLNQPITLDRGIEPNTPIKDALEFLGEKFGLTLMLDTDAFRTDLQIQEAEAQPVRLPKMNQVRVEQVLRLLTRQVQGDYFVDRDGIVWIVPRDTLVTRLLNQTVTISFNKTPLNEALKKLSDEAGFSVVLDERRAADKGKTPVTADLRNVSVDAAILILADLAELKAVTINRAMYVTTAENATEIREELERKRQDDEKRREGMPPAPAAAGA